MAEKELESQSDQATVGNEQTTGAPPSKWMTLWRGEWKEETRIPLWHEEFRDTRIAVAKEWFKTGE
jgi:hypothetical protein